MGNFLKQKKLSFVDKSEIKQNLSLPKPIIIKIIANLEEKDLLHFSLSCKMMNNLMQTEMFYQEMCHKRIKEEEIKKYLEEKKTWKEIFKESFTFWDESLSNPFIQITGRKITLEKKGISNAFTKFSFITGDENLLFVFYLDGIDTSLVGAGIIKEER